MGDLIKSLELDAVALKSQITDLCYFMAGGLEWNSAWSLSFEDREIITKVLNKRFKEKNPKSQDYM